MKMSKTGTEQSAKIGEPPKQDAAGKKINFSAC